MDQRQQTDGTDAQAADDHDSSGGLGLGSVNTVAGLGIKVIEQRLPRAKVPKIKRREQLYAELQRNLPSEDAELVVIRVDKEKHYPDPDERVVNFTASYWMKYEVKGVTDRHIEVFTSIQYVVIRDGVARPVEGDDVPGATKVFVVGRIPIDKIAHINWEPDDAYALPRVYCVYWRSPIEEWLLAQRFDNDYFQILDGVKYKPKRVWLWTRIRYGLRYRKSKREATKQRYSGSSR